MLPLSLLPSEVEFRKLDGPPPPWFDCGRTEQNSFLQDRAWSDQENLLSTTYLGYVDGLPAAYATVCMDALPLSRRERGAEIPYRDVSSVKLAQMGVHHTFQGRGLGAIGVGFVVDLARYAAQRIGCRYVTLDARPDLVPWYGLHGFVTNRLRQQERLGNAVEHHRDPATVPVSMRFDLRTIAADE